MDKKPIKRNEHIVKLSKDHHASLLFCWKIRQGIRHQADTGRMVKYVNYFWAHHFSSHFKEEEEILFAPLKDDKTRKAIDEHIKIKSIIDEIISSGAGNQIHKLADLADMVDEHVRYEERILFPHLEINLTEEQLKNIGRQISGEPLKDNYEDTFWIKPRAL